MLTGNVRAARALAAAHAEQQRSLAGHGRSITWPTPRIFDWKGWLGTLWDEYTRWSEDAPLLLSAMQEHQLWKRVQGADRDRVVAPERMADLAEEAYTLLGSYQAHRLRAGAATTGAHEDAARFLEWADAFDRLCAAEGWMARSRLEEQLTRHIAALRSPQELVLLGFDRTTPAQSALLAAFQAAGTQLSRWEPEAAHGDSPPQVIAFADPRAELEACARWCRELLEDKDGDSVRIGVIAPDLGRVRGGMERIFRRVLMPQTTTWHMSDADVGPKVAAPGQNHPHEQTRKAETPADPPLPYEFSLGRPLAQVPVVRAALLILGWLQAPLAAAELTWLLTSGLLAASAADQAALARADAELRQATDTSPRVPLAAVLDRRRCTQLPAIPRERLGRVLAWSSRERLAERGRARGRSFAAWAELAAGLLVEAGWPGLRTEDSAAYQARQRWSSLLDDMAQLSFDGSQPSWGEFLRLVQEQAAKTIFALESLAPPIQILGAFESSGQGFDAVWFLGADDQQWPATGRPHPLLPAWLQRETGMPHASAEMDWLLGQEATRRILASAPRVVLSYPIQDKGVMLRASPLLPGLGPAAATPAAAGPAPSPVVGRASADLGALLSPTALERIADDSGQVPWPAEQSAGGAEILKRQAACAFQSFAARRLEARPLGELDLGLDAAERGTLLHKVMERLWSTEPGDPLRLHTHDDLVQAAAQGSVTALVTHHIDAEFATRQPNAEAGAWQQAYFACERERVLERVLAWLDCELERRPFTVSALEQTVPAIHVGGLQLKVRPDRIDTLADGTHLLLDYKTGAVAVNAWSGARPEEPQLPLYAVFGNVDQVSSVAFAQVRADQTALLVRAEDAAEQVAASLGPATLKNRLDHEIRDEWRSALVTLAGQFVAGDARVNPRNGAKTCKWCPLPGLCRVHAQRELDEEEDDSEADA